MKRHAFSIDLLRQELTTETVLETFEFKSELTLEDIDRIESACQKIIAACKAQKSLLD